MTSFATVAASRQSASSRICEWSNLPIDNLLQLLLAQIKAGEQTNKSRPMHLNIAVRGLLRADLNWSFVRDWMRPVT